MFVLLFRKGGTCLKVSISLKSKIVGGCFFVIDKARLEENCSVCVCQVLNQWTDASLSASTFLALFDARYQGAAVLRRMSQTVMALLVLLPAYLQDLPPTISFHCKLSRNCTLNTTRLS